MNKSSRLMAAALFCCTSRHVQALMGGPEPWSGEMGSWPLQAPNPLLPKIFTGRMCRFCRKMLIGILPGREIHATSRMRREGAAVVSQLEIHPCWMGDASSFLLPSLQDAVGSPGMQDPKIPQNLSCQDPPAPGFATTEAFPQL